VHVERDPVEGGSLYKIAHSELRPVDGPRPRCRFKWRKSGPAPVRSCIPINEDEVAMSMLAIRGERHGGSRCGASE
jgi:hypothetical protein